MGLTLDPISALIYYIQNGHWPQYIQL